MRINTVNEDDIFHKNPGLTVYELRKKINWTIGKLNHYVQKLVNDGIINNSSEVINNRNQKRYYGKIVKEFINWEFITFLLDFVYQN